MTFESCPPQYVVEGCVERCCELSRAALGVPRSDCPLKSTLRLGHLWHCYWSNKSTTSTDLMITLPDMPSLMKRRTTARTHLTNEATNIFFKTLLMILMLNTFFALALALPVLLLVLFSDCLQNRSLTFPAKSSFCGEFIGCLQRVS